MAVWQYAQFTHTPFPYEGSYADKYAEYAKHYAMKYDNMAI